VRAVVNNRPFLSETNLDGNKFKASTDIPADKFTVKSKQGRILTPHGSNWKTKKIREKQTKSIVEDCQMLKEKLVTLR
jgi:hypothetical protein